MKKIWLINQYAMPPKYEMRIQTLKRAFYLKEAGYDVTIITGSFLHNTKINLINDQSKFLIKEYDGVKYIHIKTSSYKGNGMMRVWNSLEFPVKLFFLAKNFQKPDILIQLATIPFGNLIYFVAKRFKSKYIVDVVDLWPESFVAYGLISKNNPLTKLAYLAEKWIYTKADQIIFSMEGGKDYIIKKGWNKEKGGKIDLNNVHYINNGVDLNDFEFNKSNYQISDPDLENKENFKVIYLGSIRRVNNIKLLIEAASLLINYRNIKFLIYGEGEERDKLELYCKQNNIINVIFKEKWIELKYVPYVLSKSSLNILNYQPSSIMQYGGSQSKSFQYMASGKPICCNVKMGYCPITKYNLGIAKEFNSAQEYADAILYIFNMKKDEYNLICENNLNAAKNYDYKFLTSKLEKIL